MVTYYDRITKYNKCIERLEEWGSYYTSADKRLSWNCSRRYDKSHNRKGEIMKEEHLREMIYRIKSEGYDREVPAAVLKHHLVKYTGIDKYKLKYTLETLVELGFFSWVGINTLTINDVVV